MRFSLFAAEFLWCLHVVNMAAVSGLSVIFQIFILALLIFFFFLAPYQSGVSVLNQEPTCILADVIHKSPQIPPGGRGTELLEAVVLFCRRIAFSVIF